MNLAATVAIYAGGPGSGCNPAVGTCGRHPGDGGILSVDEKYVKGLAADLKTMTTRAGHAPDIAYALGFRTNLNDPAFAMAKYVEDKSSRAAMLSALDSGMSWNTNPYVATEWQAAQAQGAASIPKLESRPGWPPIEPLSKDEQAAFAARTEFVQAWVRENYGDEITVYRGIHGAQAKGIDSDEPVNLKVRGLASFTTDKSNAYNFTGSGGRQSKSGRVVTTTITPGDVFWTNDLGPKGIIRFTDDHGELVVLSKTPTRKVNVL